MLAGFVHLAVVTAPYNLETHDMNGQDDIFTSEKFSIEPDLGDQRRSSHKALPSPPTTPRRIMVKYRISAAIVSLFAIIHFVLTIVVLVAGTQNHQIAEGYLVSLNTSRLGQDVIRFETVDNAAAPSPTPTTSSTAGAGNLLNPFSTNNPLNPQSSNNPLQGLDTIFGSVSGNLTRAIDAGLESVINNVTKEVVTSAGIKSQYTLYLQRICSVDEASSASTNAGENCSTYEDASKAISHQLNDIDSSVTIGNTKISVPLLAKASSSGSSLLGLLDGVRKAIFAFLVIALIGSGVAALACLPGILFPQSRFIVYINLSAAFLSMAFTLLAAIIVTILVVAVSSLGNGIGETVGVGVKKGALVLVLVWCAWASVTLVGIFWSVVWYLEVRSWAIVRKTMRGRASKGDASTREPKTTC